MRPLYATDSKEQLAQACERLARFAHATRHQMGDKRLWLALAGTLALIIVLHRPQQEASVRWAHTVPPPVPALPTPQPEVRRAILVPAPRAQLVNPGSGWRLAAMPYGENVWTRYLGELPNQEALPLSGNHIGDSYNVGPYHFVWVNPGGVAQWIDPVQ